MLHCMRQVHTVQQYGVSMRSLRAMCAVLLSQGAMLGDTLLHIACREGYDVMVAFMLDPATKSRFETLVRVLCNIVCTIC
jgi:hypothetical protein